MDLNSLNLLINSQCGTAFSFRNKLSVCSRVQWRAELACVIGYFAAVAKYPNKSHLKKEGFILARSLSGQCTAAEVRGGGGKGRGSGGMKELFTLSLQPESRELWMGTTQLLFSFSSLKSFSSPAMGFWLGSWYRVYIYMAQASNSVCKWPVTPK